MANAAVWWSVPTRVLMGGGLLAEGLAASVRSAGIRRPVLVADAGLAPTPWATKAAVALDAAGATAAATFTAVEPNPRDGTVERLAEAVRDVGADGLVALGGGSVMDAAKAAAALAVEPPGTAAIDLEGLERWTAPPLPVVCAPTTCGTGSEVTRGAVVTSELERRKFSIKGAALFPRAAVVDFHTLRTLPPETVRNTGVDALVHAVEARLCRPGVANPVSDALAEKAVAALMANLRAAVDPPPGAGVHDAALEEVMRASTLAGLAFSNADVGAVHCISETIGGLFDVPHGLGNAVFLAPTLRHHLPHAEEQLAALHDATCRDVISSRAGAAQVFLDEVERLVRDLGVPPYADLGIPRWEDARIAELSSENGSNGSNPHPMSEANYMAILRDAWGGSAEELAPPASGAPARVGGP